MFVINMLSIRHQNNSYDHENNEKYRQKPTNSVETSRRKCRSYLNRNLCSDNFISDPLDVFSKLMGTIHFRIIGKRFQKEPKLQKKSEFFLIMKTRVIEVLRLIVTRKTTHQINYGCSKKKSGPVITETDLLFMKIS